MTCHRERLNEFLPRISTRLFAEEDLQYYRQENKDNKTDSCIL